MIADKDESDQAARQALNERMGARRRLLRGTFAVPTVLTLSSGSALAASSSLRCFTNSPNYVNSPPDNYFRVQRWVGKVANDSSVKLVKGSDIASLAAVNGFLVGNFGGTVQNERWIRVDNSGVVNPAGNDGQSGPALDGSYVALRLERTGGTDASPVFTVMGLASSSELLSGTGQVMTHSCWASI